MTTRTNSMTLGAGMDWRRTAAATRSFREAQQIKDLDERRRAMREHFDRFVPAQRCRIHA